ncbi:MAG TPA: Pls/PosA family non-ribosomal peptide synthetase, partial [Pseudonocardia sp.]|nr:Pls/PosA family non-ribosomal peptide synthetase [Pseudonocardia sp.]
SPNNVHYLKALGARIGRGVTIFSGTVPVCTDLLTIGDGTVVGSDVSFAGYRAQDGAIQTGPVRVGSDVLVGNTVVLDIGTSIGDGAQLGHTSSLHSGQAVPAGERWHGSPAQRTDVNYRAIRSADCGRRRRAAFATLQLCNLFLLTPLFATAVLLVLQRISYVADLVGPGPIAAAGGMFYLQQLALSAVVFFGGVLVGPVVVLTVPRLLHRALRPNHVYRLYGVRYWLYRFVTRTTNTPFYIKLFGDSSYITGYLRAIGYRIPRFGQTGSNFGATLKHGTPYLCSVGANTMVSDGANLMSADFSSTSFRIAPLSVGANSFLGNAIVYPAGGKIGENCLVGTKTMIPVEGPDRTDVGLLGSPCFEIPRSSQRDGRLDLSRAEFRHRLRAKNRHNVRTMGIFLLAGWLRLYGTMLISFTAIDSYAQLGVAALAAGSVLAIAFNFFFSVLQERASAGFRRLSPQFCSIYDPYFWWHERFWKLSGQAEVLNGTPFKGWTWRMVGLRVGRRVFVDGCGITEMTLVSIGDDVVLNAGSTLQSHSMEDGTFKSDHITIGNGVTLGTGAFVHYGARIGDGALVAADAFLMKGEQVPAGSVWRGNPAQPVRGSGCRGKRRRLSGTTSTAAPATLPRSGGPARWPRRRPAPCPSPWRGRSWSAGRPARGVGEARAVRRRRTGR